MYEGSILVFFFIGCAFTLQCFDENKQPVDWFIVYKLPLINNANNESVKTGFTYIYLTSNMNYDSWVLSNKTINDTDSIIAINLHSFYKRNNDLLYILYNNEPPFHPSKPAKGHTKGVILGDNEGGIWLIHSVPKFPQFNNYLYPSSGRIYGQHFLCVSLDVNNLNKVGIQLGYNQPGIYGQNIPSNMKLLLPDLTKVALNVSNLTPPWYNVLDMETVNGCRFISFAKSRKFNKELYVDLVAPYLSTDLIAETWLSGSGRLPSNCSMKFKVYNVEEVVLKDVNVSFGDHKDHSKWAVSAGSKGKFYICIGDINREEHQKIRGGGTVCFNNEILAKNYQSMVGSVEACP